MSSSTSGKHIFISHATADDAFVKQLREKLELHHLNVWVDSLNLRGGDKLWPEVAEAIRTARHVLMVISTHTVNSSWVRKEVRLAEQAGVTVIPLLLPGILPAALGMWFDEEPAGEKIELDVGKLQEAMPRILAALGERLPDDLPTEQQVENKPLAELLLELTEPTLTRNADGSEQLSARATLTYTPADLSKEREVTSRPFRFTAPIGQIEQDELRWYLEDYLHWPVGLFRDRAQRTEAQLPQWGAKLSAAVLDKPECQAVKAAWHNTRTESERLFSVLVETALLEDASDAEKANANTAASRLQSLPWELLHDGKGYVSDGKYPVRIRRRLPNYDQKPPSITQLPIRILLLSPRPEQAGVGYIDHRASALPLVEGVATLGELVQVSVLTPPTLGALEKELRRASEADEPYHVVHFDGHGIYDQQHGLGALCFEDPQDSHELKNRRMQLVHADKLAALLRDYRIPLVFLEACQTAQTDTDPSASVAAKLLEEGIASVVAMTHSVLVVTARRFVTQFYRTLAEGQRIGKAMLAGQTALMRDTFRLPIAGAGDLHLQDWFVPILYQEQHDPQLFARLPSATAQLMTAQQRQTRLGRLPEPPPHRFIGRSRELLQVERLLEQQPYAVLRGQGGVGKTTLAVELARWLVQSRRFERCAFVSVEQYTHPDYVLEQLLQQLVNPNHNFAAEYASDTDKALQAIRRVLENERVLIVVDNVEALLADEGNVGAVSQLLAKLLTPPSPTLPPQGGQGARVLFTTREALPAPFNHKAREIVLGALSVTDAKALVMQVMNNEGLHLRHDDQGNTPQEVDDLVRSVGCHARALVLLARELAQRGVKATTANVRAIMQELEQRHPGQRELSLFASVELSLRRLSPEVREQIAGLAVFQDGGYWQNMGKVLGLDDEKMGHVYWNLIEVGLAQPIGDYGYIRLDPALPATLDLGLTAQQREGYQQRWREVMGQLVDFLYQQHFKDTKLQSQLTQLELPNLMAYLQTLVADLQAGSVAAEVVAGKAGTVEQLLANLHQPQALAQVVAWRKQAAQALGEWSHTHFKNERMNIERLLQQGDIQTTYQAAQALLQQCQQAGEQAYAWADYDLAMAHSLLGRVLNRGGAAAQALPYLQEAQRRFESLGESGASMASAALTEQGDCLRALGQLEAAAAAYEDAIARDEKREDTRSVVVNKGQLATTRLYQKRYADALQGYQQALALFQQLDEPGAVATAWHQIGMTHRDTGDFAQAEQAYRQSLSINIQQGDEAGEASSLGELGTLYVEWNRPEQAVSFYRQAADIAVAIGDKAQEGIWRSNLTFTLIKFQRYDEARPELLRAIECKQAFGHAAEPWTTWDILHDLERASGNPLAAREARQQALAAYLAYRRDGGENHHWAGRLALAIGQAIQQKNTVEVEQVIRELLQDGSYSENLLHKLQAIIAGERDLALAEDEGLHYQYAAELVLLLEGLE
ncbi:tetratricopeptide repeat protein [Thiothrix fructosivorans]|uniref:Tetratricopeptide repeat protein n=1 Tax=Thiothrix fructosivorans TaxID=111770 RepID=A0A8B0SJD1_9GAMM|nr:tetratricopeptide repeat protein [Thiothrix fructosivorans]MBO0614251.1 tetratricopeptide repeat protein [Thiothrix fructosivorans]QTX09102.1 tetratricopeptide repeat protein [Thiothrix fructosivorans]